jgi:hypothetical protein
MDCPQAYCQISIAGPLNERWVDYVGDMFLTLSVEEGRIKTTTLVGRPSDLAAYIGMLNALHNLGLTVIATQYQQVATVEALAANGTDPAQWQGRLTNHDSHQRNTFQKEE